MRRPIAVLLTAGLAVAFATCSKEGRDGSTGSKDAGPGGTNPSGDSGPGDAGAIDAGPQDSGPPPCTFHTDCAADERCEDSTGRCLQAYPCAQTSDCNFRAVDQDPPDPLYAYCGGDYDGCACVQDYCKPRVAFCHRCTVNDDCVIADGSRSVTSQCAADRPSGAAKYCLPTTSNGCTSILGFAYPSTGTLCQPGTPDGTCDGFAPCDQTHPCVLEGPRPLCDLNHVCRPACFDKEECAPSQVCHLLASLLATTANTGGGKCGEACTDNTPCSQYGAGYVCMRDPPVTTGPKRCRIAGCLNDRECPAPDQNGEYCQLADHTCVHSGCQTHDDCGLSAGEKLQKCNASKQCEEATCDQAGGNVSCPPGEICCGVEGGLPCDSGDSGKCIKADNGTFCDECKHQDGDAPDHAQCSAAPNACDFSQGQTKWVCAVACETGQQCPSGWGCTHFRPKLCSDNSDCAPTGEGDCSTESYTCKCKGGVCPSGFRCTAEGQNCVTKACVPGTCPIP